MFETFAPGSKKQEAIQAPGFEEVNGTGKQIGAPKRLPARTA